MSTFEIENRISELLRELADQEVESRYLRSEVANLERAAILISPQTSADGESAQSSALQVHQDPAANKLVPSKTSQQSLVHPFMPEEFLDTLSDKREIMIKAQRDYIALCEEKKRLVELVERNKVAAEGLNADLERFYERAKWRPGASTNYACPITTDNENSRLKKKLLEVYQEAQTTQKQMIKQTDQLKSLALELESMQHVDEEHFGAQTELRLKNGELKAVMDEINSCARIYQQKEKYLAKISDHSRDKEQIRHIDADKRVAQKALVGHKDQARQADAGIRHRALLITLLEERIEIIGEAIRGDASPSASEESSNPANQSAPAADVPRVDVQFVERIRNDILRLQKLIAENTHIIDIADSQLEIAEDRVRIIERSTNYTASRLDKTKEGHVAFNEVLGAEVADHRTEVLSKMAYYEKLNANLSNKVGEMRGVIAAAEASRRADMEQQQMRSVGGGSFASAGVRAATPPPTPSRMSFAASPNEEAVMSGTELKPTAFDRSPHNVRSHSRAMSSAEGDRAASASRLNNAENYSNEGTTVVKTLPADEKPTTALDPAPTPTNSASERAPPSAPTSGVEPNIKQDIAANVEEEAPIPAAQKDAFAHSVNESVDKRPNQAEENESHAKDISVSPERKDSTEATAPSPTGPAMIEETPAPTPVATSQHHSTSPHAAPTADESFRGESVSDFIDPTAADREAASKFNEMSEFKAFGDE